MSLTRCVTYSLYPNRQQLNKLHYWRRMHCNLYNAAVANRKTQWRRYKHSVSYFEQQNSLPEFKKVWYEFVELGSHALQATLKRVDLAFNRFFRKLGGYPKFKSELCGGSFPRKRLAASRRYAGWSYPDIAGWKALTDGKNGYLELSNLGKIQMRGQARTWGKPTTCTIFWRNNNWYASITVNCLPERLTTGTGAVGMDLGCEQAITFWDGEQSERIENPRFFGKTLAKIKKTSRQLRRKTAPNFKKKVRASSRYRKSQSKVNKLKKKSTNQRKDWIHQVAAQITKSNSLVATEELNIKGMTSCAKKGKRKRQKAGLNRSILDVGMGELLHTLDYKLHEAGGFLIKAPTKKIKPSQSCPSCGHQRKKDLQDRTHYCEICHFQTGRDVAAAMVCLNYALGLGTNLNTRGVQTSTVTPTGGWQQVWALKRETLPSP